MIFRNSLTSILLGLITISAAVSADPIIYESFTGYPDDALISDHPAGPALGLAGDWTLAPDNFFYVNRTQADTGAGSGKAVYDMPYDDNGARIAQRQASPVHPLFDFDGDVFYASFRVYPPRADGTMLFMLMLDRPDGGGQLDLSFGMTEGQFIVGSGGVNTDVVGGAPSVTEMQIVLRIEYGDATSGPDNLELVTLWVNPVDESSSPVIDEAPADLLNPGGGTLVGVAIRGDQMDGQPAFFDDLLVGFSFEDVSSAPAAFVTNPLGLNGTFFDPAHSGHGFNFVAHQSGLSVYYYGHTLNGERLWLISEVYSEEVVFGAPFELEMFEVINGTLGQPQLPQSTWGVISIELDDCDRGHASFNGLDGTLEMDFIRLTAMPGIGCQ
jgi:hypothetical protein